MSTFRMLSSKTVLLLGAPPPIPAYLRPTARLLSVALSFSNVLEGISCSWAGQGWFLFLTNIKPYKGKPVILYSSFIQAEQYGRQAPLGLLRPDGTNWYKPWCKGSLWTVYKVSRQFHLRFANDLVKSELNRIGGHLTIWNLEDKTCQFDNLLDKLQTCVRL